MAMATTGLGSPDHRQGSVSVCAHAMKHFGLGLRFEVNKLCIDVVLVSHHA